MRFLAARTSCTLSALGAQYVLHPISYPQVNIHDILAGEHGYVHRTLQECAHIQEVEMETEKIPGFPARASDLTAIPPGSKVVLMRVGGLGDMVMLTPVLRYLKERLPADVALTLATFKYAHGLFENSGFFTNVVPSPMRLSHLLEYDYVIEFFGEEDVTDCGRFNMTDHYFKVLGIDPESIDPVLKRPFLPRETASSAGIADLFTGLRRDNRRAIALASLFSSDRTRDFPVPLFQELLRRFPDVLFVVPYHDRKLLAGRMEELEEGNLIFLDTADSLTDFLTALYCCDVVVSPDSSAYHIAAAYGKPAVALFGSINPELRIRYYPSVIALHGAYRGEFCVSPCGVSNAKWIRLNDRTGREIVRRNLFAPERGCPEAVRKGDDYSPCLLAVPPGDLVQAFEKALTTPREESDPPEKESKKRMKKKDKAKTDAGRKSPRLSACMMVKNEEALLPQCLESIKNVADEIVVVDTGSTDATVRIAESFGARVYHHPWENDFSKHRNQSLSYATGDWVLIIDADEKLDSGSVSLVRKALRESPSPMIAVMVRSFTDGGKHTGGGLSVRLFRNGLGFHYKGIIHNQLQNISNPQYYPIVLWHYGYDLDEATLSRKRKRSLALLLKQAEAFPEDHATRHHIAVTYFSEQMWAEALESAEKTLALQDSRSTAGIGWTHFIMAFSLYKLGRSGEAIDRAWRGLERFPRSVDLHHLLACLNLEKGDHRAVLAHAGHYFRLKSEYERDPSAFGLDVFEMDQKEGDVHMARGFALHLLARPEEAFAALKKAENTLREQRREKLGQIGRFYLNRGDYEKALHFFLAIGMTGPAFDQNLLSVPHCLDKVGRSGEILAFYDKLNRAYPNEWEPLFQKGLYCLHCQDYEGAEETFRRAHLLNPGHGDTLINLGAALYRLGRADIAEETYLKALEIEDSASKATLSLGILHYEKGDFEKALPYLERADGETPQGFYTPLALSHLFILKGDIEKVVPLCGRLLNNLSLPATRELRRVADLGLLYYLISRELLARREFAYQEIACRVGHLLTEGVSTASNEP